MVPPKYKGKVKFIAPKGKYNIDEKLLELEFQDKTFVCTMTQKWPVREPRPIISKMQGTVSLMYLNSKYFHYFLT